MKTAPLFACSRGYAEVDGVRLHYMAAGQSKLILFLHRYIRELIR